MQSCLVADRTNSKVYNMNTPACQSETSYNSENIQQHMPAFIVNGMEPNSLSRSSEMYNSDLSLGNNHQTRVSRSNSEFGAFINAKHKDNKLGVTSLESQKQCDYTHAKTSVSTTPRKKGRLMNLTHKRKVAPMPQYREKADLIVATENSAVFSSSDVVLPQSPYEVSNNMTTTSLHNSVIERPCTGSITKAESTASFNSWTDVDYMQEHVVVERLNQDIYERRFYGQGM